MGAIATPRANPSALPIDDAGAAYLTIDAVSKVFRTQLDPIERWLARLGAGYREQVVRAVDTVSLSIQQGQVVGLVGESGCGKSTLGRVVAGLLSPTEGRVTLDGRRFDAGGNTLSERERLKVQMVFQDPMASLNPRQRVGDIVTEGARFHGLVGRREAQALAGKLLAEVGLDPEVSDRLPHQFSGGQRQRIGIARALSVSPDVLVCDEPVAALDVSIQAQIINLLLTLQRHRRLTMLFISHDLGVVRHLCDTVAVMYLGRLVEVGPCEAVFSRPSHPYTRALLAGMTRIGAGRQRFEPIKGELPSPLSPPSGCTFHPRCGHAQPICRQSSPPLEWRSDHRRVACHFDLDEAAGP